MEESGIDMGFDLAAITADLEQREANLCDRQCHGKQTGLAGIDVSSGDNKHGNGDGSTNDDWEQALSFLSTPLQDIMYYELKSRAANIDRYVVHSTVAKHARNLQSRVLVKMNGLGVFRYVYRYRLQQSLQLLRIRVTYIQHT